MSSVFERLRRGGLARRISAVFAHWPHWGWAAVGALILFSGRYWLIMVLAMALVVAGFFAFGVWERRGGDLSGEARELLRARARQLFASIARAHALQLEWLEGREREISAWLPVQPGLEREIWMSLMYEEELVLAFRTGKARVFDRYRGDWFEAFERAAHQAIGASMALPAG